MGLRFPNLAVRVISHRRQRYDTCGDYFVRRGVTQFRVSDLGDWRYETLVLVHEIAEKALCLRAGVKDADIDRFDMEYERNRRPGDNSEPGDCRRAPYYRQHQFATMIERLLARALKVNWRKYERTLYALEY